MHDYLSLSLIFGGLGLFYLFFGWALVRALNDAFKPKPKVLNRILSVVIMVFWPPVVVVLVIAMIVDAIREHFTARSLVDNFDKFFGLEKR